ncbi:hypothetical protein PG997_012325 [Apiospora hydei]|uniref:SRR1-like domain-containing protein n=1 Tax=Apiospora hydei TaxID=1337664 RepID=A0ABR1V319_9PEZI
MHRTRTFLAAIRDKDPEWLRKNVPFRFKPLTEEELENTTKEERARIIVPRLNALDSSPLVGYFAEKFHPDFIPYELDYTLLTTWIEKYEDALPTGYSFPYQELKALEWDHSDRLQEYMKRDLRNEDGLALPDDDERVVARLKEVAKLVSDKDGYSMGTSFEPPFSKDSGSRSLTLANREDILKTHEWASSQWEGHLQRRALIESFKDLSSRLQTTRIKKLVCFGLGSLSPPPFYSLAELREEHEHKNVYFGYTYLRPYFQHLAAQTIAEVLKDHNDGKPLDVYVQDVAYSEDDIGVLERDVNNLANSYARCKITVVDGSPNHHEGFLKIDSETFVLTVQPTVPLRQMVFEISSPAVILCTQTKGNGESDEDLQSYRVLPAERGNPKDFRRPSFTWTTHVCDKTPRIVDHDLQQG